MDIKHNLILLTYTIYWKYNFFFLYPSKEFAIGYTYLWFNSKVSLQSQANCFSIDKWQIQLTLLHKVLGKMVSAL